MLYAQRFICARPTLFSPLHPPRVQSPAPTPARRFWLGSSPRRSRQLGSKLLVFVLLTGLPPLLPSAWAFNELPQCEALEGLAALAGKTSTQQAEAENYCTLMTAIHQGFFKDFITLAEFHQSEGEKIIRFLTNIKKSYAFWRMAATKLQPDPLFIHPRVNFFQKITLILYVYPDDDLILTQLNQPFASGSYKKIFPAVRFQYRQHRIEHLEQYTVQKFNARGNLASASAITEKEAQADLEMELLVQEKIQKNYQLLAPNLFYPPFLAYADPLNDRVHQRLLVQRRYDMDLQGYRHLRRARSQSASSSSLTASMSLSSELSAAALLSPSPVQDPEAEDPLSHPSNPPLHLPQPGSQLESVRSFSLIYQLSTGLKYLHAAGLVHSDLKPGNILINLHPFEATIADFNTSFFPLFEPQKRSSATCESPEMVENDLENNLLPPLPQLPPLHPVQRTQYFQKRDIYALGLIALQEKDPFRATNPFQACFPHWNHTVGYAKWGRYGQCVLQFARQLETTVKAIAREKCAFEIEAFKPNASSPPQALQIQECSYFRIVSQCLSVDPMARPTAQEIADAFVFFVQGPQKHSTQ